ncbi:MAG: P-loop NTPase [Gallionella sp.]|jgi:flagellar biosynthesis protein FlhG|nr:P-loop NTPase [Gallionella sp.]
MRSEHGLDQAEGLRRLLVGKQTRIVTVVAGKAGVGRTSTTINLAAALARSGKDVLVLDENHAPNNLLEQLTLSAPRDLLDVAQGRCAVQQAVLRAQGYTVLPAARAMSALNRLQAVEQHRLEQALTEASAGVDVMLVDASLLASPSAPSSSLATGVSLLVVVDATVSGITASYALIKRLALENAKLRFEIVVNKVAGSREAMTVFANMAGVARLHLAARLEYFGYIPLDEKLKRATQLGRSVVEAFPASSSAKAYAELAQHFLHLPVEQNEANGGIPFMMQSLMRQMRSGRAAQLVN